eukprot:1737114-Pyramimonas_sp.AAC.1
MGAMMSGREGEGLCAGRTALLVVSFDRSTWVEVLAKLSHPRNEMYLGSCMTSDSKSTKLRQCKFI